MSWSARVQKFTPDGAFLSKWDSAGAEPFVTPVAIDVGPDGSIFVLDLGPDSGTMRVHRFRYP